MKTKSQREYERQLRKAKRESKLKLYDYMDLFKMSLSELKKVKKKERDTVTRAIRNLQKHGITETPATAGLEEKIRAGIVKPISQLKATPKQKPKIKREKQRLIAEIMEYQEYKKSSTGTYEGFRYYQRETEKRIGPEYQKASEDEKKRFWEIYEERRQMIEDYGLDSDRIQQKLSRYLSGKWGKKATEQTKSEHFRRLVKEEYNNVNEQQASPFGDTKFPSNLAKQIIDEEE